MKVLVLNCGSSSIKYQLHDAVGQSALARGLVSRIGDDGARIESQTGPMSRAGRQLSPVTAGD